MRIKKPIAFPIKDIPDGGLFIDLGDYNLRAKLSNEFAVKFGSIKYIFNIEAKVIRILI